MDRILKADLPEEIVLDSGDYMGRCNGDDCNSDQGGCDSDASCGQDC